VATVPVNLEFDAWFAILDVNQTSDDEPVSLHEHLLRQSWFIRLESVSRNKTIIVTTKPNLPAARAWVDANLEPMIRKSIPPDVAQPPSHALPRRLDKQIYTATSHTYADILKQQFSLSPNATTTANDNNRPPRKRQATVIDYDSDQSAESTPVPQSTSNIGTSTPLSSTTTTTVNYAAELASLKTDLNSLRSLITTAVEQLKTEIASLHATPASSNMETEVDAVKPPTENTPDLSDLLADLKHDIATKLDISDLIVELKSDIALIKSHPLFSNLPPINQRIPGT